MFELVAEKTPYLPIFSHNLVAFDSAFLFVTRRGGTVVAVEGDERKAEEEGLEMEEDESERWRFVFQETPVPGKRPTLLRMAQETNITGGDPQEWVEALGYTYAVPLSPLSFPPLPYYESR